jgi:hypothetical protein
VARETASKGAKKFKVNVRFNATAESQETVQASSKKEAKELALGKAIMPDFRRGKVTRKVMKITAE